MILWSLVLSYSTYRLLSLEAKYWENVLNAGLLFLKFAYSEYYVSPKIFETEYTQHHSLNIVSYMVLLFLLPLEFRR
jgi:hypothetical protein